MHNACFSAYWNSIYFNACLAFLYAYFVVFQALWWVSTVFAILIGRKFEKQWNWGAVFEHGRSFGSSEDEFNSWTSWISFDHQLLQYCLQLICKILICIYLFHQKKYGFTVVLFRHILTHMPNIFNEWKPELDDNVQANIAFTHKFCKNVPGTQHGNDSLNCFLRKYLAFWVSF